MNYFTNKFLLIIVSFSLLPKLSVGQGSMNQVRVTVANFESIVGEPVLRLNGATLDSDGAGMYTFDYDILSNSENVLEVDPDVHGLNGQSTLDLVLLQKGLAEDFGTSLMHLVGDVDMSGSISTIDIFEMRKAILGVIGEPDFLKPRVIVESQRDFTDFDGFDFNVDYSSLQISKTDLSPGDVIEVEVFKIGDVSSAQKSIFHKSLDRGEDPLLVTLTDRWVERGESFTISVELTKGDYSIVDGATFRLNHELLTLLYVQSSKDNSGLMYSNRDHGTTTVSYLNEDNQTHVVIELNFESQTSGWISDMITLDLNYIRDIVYEDLSSQDIELSFDSKNQLVFGIFPNPVTDILTLQLPKSTLGGVIRIYDLLGNLEHSTKGSGEIVLQRSYLGKPGLKILRVEMGDQVRTERIYVN